MSGPRDAGTAARLRFPWRATFVVWALLSALSAVWALATPIGASPDEPAHIVRAASVARGQIVGTPSPDGHVVTVPEYIALTQKDTCFAFKPDVTANCPVAAPAAPGALTTATTTAGLYNPLYYAAVGWTSLLFHDSGGIYAMRLVSAVIASLFAALAFGVLRTLPGRRIAALGFAVAITPMTLFLNASVNPNGIEATATLAVFAGVLAVVIDRRPGLIWHRAVIAGVSGIVAVNARGLSPLWVFVAAVLPLVLLSGRELGALLRRPAVLTAIGAIAVGAVAALAWTLGSNSLLNAVDNPDQTPQHYAGVGTNPLTGAWLTLTRTVEFAHGVVGIFGWLDTPAPAEVYFLWAALVGLMLLAAFTLLRRRRLLLAGLLLGAFLLLPPIVQGVYITGGGLIWQGRYNLPMFLCMVVGVGVLLGESVLEGATGPGHWTTAPWASVTWRRLGWIVAVALAFGQFYSFENTLRRYTVGIGGSLKQMLVGSSPWTPPGGAAALLALFAGLCVVGVWLTLREAFGPRAPKPAPALVTPAATGLE
ncbi:DUF2142 domain-containing protein [Leifsonia shinshuensis]|uniref:DUF2142 domain-containing protein n=1 Tax=Leifsonia shinshuensis TaxID=150026 RepID=A0A853CX38_9MICO|nr:DUF2142 domain-containing protein [Leifsonia shinshuensis]NYJ25062.1 hypothetical protein [Leifsonia shinshuensis]